MNKLSETLGYYYNYLPAVPVFPLNSLNFFKKADNDVPIESTIIQNKSNATATTSSISYTPPCDISTVGSLTHPKLILYLSSIFISIFSLLLPLVSTYNTIVLKNNSRVRELLLFWMIFGLTILIESLVPIILVIPFYNYIKIVFFWWCMNLYSKGANIIYSIILQPVLSSHSVYIDHEIKFLEDLFNQIFNSISKQFSNATIAYRNEIGTAIKKID